MKKTLQLLLLVALPIFARESFGQTVFDRQHDLFVAAINDGSASGVLVGDVDEHFTRQFRSTGALHVNARTIKSYKREGCKRLEVVFTKKDVSTPAGITDAILKMQVNYCRDGSPPIVLE